MQSQPRHTVRRIAVVALCTLGISAHAQSPKAEESEESRANLRDISLGFPEADEVAVTRLAAQLSDPAYALREEAAGELARLGPGAFRVMSHVFRETDDYETRLQIEEIVRDQFLWHALLKHRGFLGIGYAPEVYPQLGEGVIAIRVSVVRPGSAAADAGLRRDDLIVALDGVGFTDNPNQPDFKDRVEKKGANGRMSLDVVRRNRLLRFEVQLRARPISEYTQQEMLDELNHTMQTYSAWRAKFFSLPEDKPARTPSHVVLEIPD